jgi:hypothetical protein
MGSGQTLYQAVWKNYTVIAAVEDSSIARSVSEQIRNINQEYQAFFTRQLNGTILIQLTRSVSEYEKMTGNAAPDWSGAVAFRDEQRIIIRPESPSAVSHYKELLRHEIAHLYLQGTYLPLWIEEGVAMYLSGKTISWWEHIRIGNSVSSDNIISLSEIDYLLSFGYAKAKLAYLQSLTAVHYIIALYGVEGLQQLIAAADTKQTVNVLFLKGLQTDFDSFERDYIQFLEKRYRYMFMLQFEYLLLFLMVLLVLLAYLRIKIRNRRIVARWEEM